MAAPDVVSALARFGVSGKEVRAEPLTQGLINTAYKVFVDGEPLYVLQKVNTGVFESPGLLMENISLLLPFLEGEGYTGISLRPTTEGGLFLKDESLGVWRMFDYIPDSVTVEHTRSPEVAREAGRVLGRFHQLASRASLSDVHTTLPGFHDLGHRSRQFEQALSEGIPERIERSAPLTRMGRKLIESCAEIPFTRLPLRLCHNDTKLSNFLFDQHTGRGLCLIDLDTLMPGYLLYDFGDAAYDLLRPEGDNARGLAGIDMGMLQAYVQGIKDSGLGMVAEEVRWLPHGVVLMPLLHGIRALADYMVGDRYYRVTYPGQNLDRAGSLLGFAESANARLPEIRAACHRILG